MTELVTAFIAALLAGFLGSVHCLGMCAGVSGLIAINASARSLRSQLPLAVVYNAGRIVSYAVLGAIVASFGEVAVAAVPAVAVPVRIAGAIVIVLIGLQIAFRWRLLEPVERAGSSVWQIVAPLANKLLPVTSAPRALSLGLLWGLLPCGLVYSALLIAAASAAPQYGALIMLVFGIGTTPAMVMTGVGTLQLSRIAGTTRRAAGILVITLGLLTLAMPVRHWLAPTDHSHHM